MWTRSRLVTSCRCKVVVSRCMFQRLKRKCGRCLFEGRLFFFFVSFDAVVMFLGPAADCALLLCISEVYKQVRKLLVRVEAIFEVVLNLRRSLSFLVWSLICILRGMQQVVYQGIMDVDALGRQYYAHAAVAKYPCCKVQSPLRQIKRTVYPMTSWYLHIDEQHYFTTHLHVF